MDNGKFIVCRASAGSGKTFTLVKTFLRLAFDVKPSGDWTKVRQRLEDRFKHILAITFTNKAVNEMKTRIMSELKTMAADSSQSDMAKAILKEWQDEGKNISLETLQQYADVVRSAILHDYTDLSVCTIDKFMHRVVRTFAHDLGLPLNFDVTQKQDEVVEQVVSDMMASIGEEGEDELTNMLIAYSESQMESDHTVNIERLIAKLCDELFKENVPDFLNRLSHLSLSQFKQMAQQLRADNKTWATDIQQKASTLLNECHAKGLEVGDFAGGKNGALAYLERIAHGDVEKKITQTVQRFIKDPDKLGSASCKEDKVESIAAVKGKVCDVISQQQEGLKLYNSRNALLGNLYALALLNRLKTATQQFYKDNEVLHLSEFNQRIAEVVKDEPIPFIYERLGSHYWNYLIDEFQDTSTLQWQNLMPLVDNGVSSGHTSLIVGDGKQAIYRFRQGDAKQFARLPQVSDDNGHGHGQIFQVAFQPESLDTNFRSCRNIIDFNNNLFYWIVTSRFSEHKDMRKIYLDAYQTKEDSSLWQKSRKDGGYVKVDFLADDDYANNVHKALYQTIKEQIEKGYQYKDICIISRKNRTLSAIGQHLSGEEINGASIPMISSESFLLNNSRIVTLILSFLRYMADRNDGASSAQVLFILNMTKRLSVNPTETFASRNKIPLEKILCQEGFDIDLASLASMPLYDCCEEIIRCLGIDGIEPDYTAAFLNLVASFSENHQQNIPQFLEWYDNLNGDGKLSAKTSDDLNAIKLMTIHKAKGLESPIILYPIFTEKKEMGAEWSTLSQEEQQLLNIEGLSAALIPLSQENSTLFDPIRDAENMNVDMDNLNVFYVALTRPREKLFLYAPMPKPPQKGDPPRKDYASLLYDFQSADAWQEIISNDDKTSYHIGEDTPKEPPKDNDPEDTPVVIKLGEMTHAHWDKRLRIAYPEMAASDATHEEQRRQGIIMHDLLSRIHSSNDIESALAYCHTQYGLEADEIAQTEARLRKVITDLACAKFFMPGNEVKNECNIADHGRVRRPDRIVITPQETFVIDFKTGFRKEQDREQVKEYCNIIKEMGYPNVSGHLIYIEDLGCHVETVISKAV